MDCLFGSGFARLEVGSREEEGNEIRKSFVSEGSKGGKALFSILMEREIWSYGVGVGRLGKMGQYLSGIHSIIQNGVQQQIKASFEPRSET